MVLSLVMFFYLCTSFPESSPRGRQDPARAAGRAPGGADTESRGRRTQLQMERAAAGVHRGENRLHLLFTERPLHAGAARPRSREAAGGRPPSREKAAGRPAVPGRRIRVLRDGDGEPVVQMHSPARTVRLPQPALRLGAGIPSRPRKTSASEKRVQTLHDIFSIATLPSSS